VLDTYLAKTVMTHIFVLTAAALLPPLLALYDMQEKWIWQSSAVLFAPPMLALQVTFRAGAARRSARDRRPQYSRSLLCSVPL
jgi:hypothetical protein